MRSLLVKGKPILLAVLFIKVEFEYLRIKSHFFYYLLKYNFFLLFLYNLELFQKFYTCIYLVIEFSNPILFYYYLYMCYLNLLSILNN